MARLPLYIGGNIVAFTALLTAFICTAERCFAARSRASSLLRQEMLRGTLDGLQLLPIREERWLWMMSTHLCWCRCLSVRLACLYICSRCGQIMELARLTGLVVSVCMDRTHCAIVATSHLETKNHQDLPQKQTGHVASRVCNKTQPAQAMYRNLTPAQRMGSGAASATDL
jgi:hypothetical protein